MLRTCLILLSFMLLLCAFVPAAKTIQPLQPGFAICDTIEPEFNYRTQFRLITEKRRALIAEALPLKEQQMEVQKYKRNRQIAASTPLQSFVRSWLMLSRTDTGYIEYQPCQGVGPSVIFEEDYMIVSHRLQSYVYFLKDFQQVSPREFVVTYFTDAVIITPDSKNYFQKPAVKVLPDTDISVVQAKVKIVDASRQMAVWTWADGSKWLTVPTALREQYPMFYNVCPMDIPEREFLPIDFESLEKEADGMRQKEQQPVKSKSLKKQ